MAGDTVWYSINVEVDDRYAPGLAALTDAVADELERHGARESDYNVVTHGPPELRIVGVGR